MNYHESLILNESQTIFFRVTQYFIQKLLDKYPAIFCKFLFLLEMGVD